MPMTYIAEWRAIFDSVWADEGIEVGLYQRPFNNRAAAKGWLTRQSRLASWRGRGRVFHIGRDGEEITDHYSKGFE